MSGVHSPEVKGHRVVCTCGDWNCASLDYTACSFALGRGGYCKGDVRFPHTHATLCPHFGDRDSGLTTALAIAHAAAADTLARVRDEGAGS